MVDIFTIFLLYLEIYYQDRCQKLGLFNNGFFLLIEQILKHIAEVFLLIE